MDFEDLARRLAVVPGAPARSGAERQAAVAILLRGEGADPEVLLMKRAEREDDRWSGQIGLPGGHAEAQDPDLYATALREAREEVGIDLGRAARLLGRLAPVQARARGQLLPMQITPFVFGGLEPLAPQPGPEAVDVFWFPLGRARSGELAATFRHPGAASGLALPCWRFQERVVWGLTYEILSGFLRVAF